MFGAMLSATDPISVTATLKSLGASELLNTLIEGESLVNDGSAFVLWEEFFQELEGGHAEVDVGAIIGNVFKLSVGGAAMGVAFGLVALIILGLVYDEFEVETSLTVIVAFLGFWTAQAPSRLSGVICNVASGLVLSAFGRHLITPAVREPLQEFWELLGWAANTIVFVHAGVLVTAFTWSCSGSPNGSLDYVYIIVYYLFLQVIRIGLVLLFRPLMAVGNKWFQWKEAIVVGFSGLRGAVSLILALEVAGSDLIDERVKARVVLWTTGIVALSLLINGFFIKPVIHKLKLDKAEKTREDFLHRARAVMVQRTLMILDSLCIETAFKSARWSYVAKNSLPQDWISDDKHAAGYREALEQMETAPIANRKSLEVVRSEHLQRVMHTQVTRRLSQDIHSIRNTPNFSPRETPRVSTYEFMPLQQSARDSGQYPRLSRQSQDGAGSDARSSLPIPVLPRPYPDRIDTQTPSAITLQSSPVPPRRLSSLESLHVSPVPLGDISLGRAARQEVDRSLDVRRSIDADIVRYQRNQPVPVVTEAGIHAELAEVHRKMLTGKHVGLNDEDREVSRRLLTAILSHVRAFSNTSLVEYSVLLSLEEDLQFALDANEEGRDYDIFSFLEAGRSKGKKNFIYGLYLRLIEGKRLGGQSSITTAILVFGIMTEVLKEEILHESPVVQLQAEELYEGAAALLNRLEALNPSAFEWVESQMAIYVAAKKQDDVLEDLLASGIVDDQEYKVVHEELIEVRRRHVRARHSIFQRSTLPPRPQPRAMIRMHPLFSSLSPTQLSEVVDRFGELVHLKGGQALQSERGSLVVVLQGAIRPLEDTFLPATVAARLRKANTEVEMAVTGHSPRLSSPTANESPRVSISSEGVVKNDELSRTGTGFIPLASGATMHWCFPQHNGFCGSVVTLHAHSKSSGLACDIAQERAIDTQFCCCEIAGSATVFTLPVTQVKRLARESEEFRMEITRSLAREIVLESVADQRPYSLSHFMDSIIGNIDVSTVVGRAFRVLERLPYMKVIRLHAGERSSVHMQGPGVLLNGTVRVSIVDTSGLVGAINLLHEELTGPALLPAGGLILQEVHKPGHPDALQSRFKSTEILPGLTSETAVDVSETITAILEDGENESCRAANTEPEEILAHVLIEEVIDDDVKALMRLKRWKLKEEGTSSVDMNGRFGMFRHVELAPLIDTKIET